jgi:2-keto-4-pentenoate hydratase
MTDQALLLADAQRSGETLTSFEAPRDLADAEAIQDRMIAYLDIQPGGWKLGATTAPVRERFAIDHGFIGLVPEDRVLQSGCTVALSDLRQSVVEQEIAFTLGQDLPPRAALWTDAEVREAIAGVRAAIELPQSRFPGLGAFGPLALAADNGAAGWIIVGDLVTDWDEAALGQTRCSLQVDGVECATGDATDIIGGPLHAFAELLRFAQQRGHGLKAGQHVLTGACALFNLEEPGVVLGQVDGVGSVGFTLV